MKSNALIGNGFRNVITLFTVAGGTLVGGTSYQLPLGFELTRPADVGFSPDGSCVALLSSLPSNPCPQATITLFSHAGNSLTGGTNTPITSHPFSTCGQSGSLQFLSNSYLAIASYAHEELSAHIPGPLDSITMYNVGCSTALQTAKNAANCIHLDESQLANEHKN